MAEKIYKLTAGATEAFRPNVPGASVVEGDGGWYVWFGNHGVRDGWCFGTMGEATAVRLAKNILATERRARKGQRRSP